MERIRVDSELEIIVERDNWTVVSKGKVIDNSIPVLYKYYSLNGNNIDALDNSYIYLSNPKSFNDPFDCNRNLIKEGQKKLEDWDYVESLNDIPETGITCFSENGMDPLMWGHYTNSFSGFCIKIKSDFSPQDVVELKRLAKVIYSNDPNSISINSKFSKLYRLLIKSKSWSYEKEWRFLFTDPESISNKFYYNPNCIEEISVGYQFSESNNKLRDKFLEIKKRKFKDIPLYTVGPHQTKLELQKILLFEGTVEDGMGKIYHDLQKLKT